MASDGDHELTRLLEAWNRGDRGATETLVSVVYDKLRRMAEAYMRRERPGHAWQPADLVHETLLRLFEQKKIPGRDRCQFFTFAGGLMRRVLVDHARHSGREKRGGGRVRIPFDDVVRMPGPEPRALALAEALRDLAAVDPERSEVVRLHFFAGLSVAETAAALHCSESTVTRRWRGAKSWLHRELRP